MNMIKYAGILILFALLSRAEVVPRMPDEYDPAKWPLAELKFSQAGTLKDVFDSGLRPYRFPGMENTTLESKHLSLVILLESGKRLPLLRIEMLRIKPFRDGEISLIEGYTPKLTLAQAREEMLKWFPYGENKRSEQELDHYLAAVKKDHLDFDDPYRGLPDGCGIGWYEPGFKTKGGGPQIGIGFRKTASQTHPLSLHFNMSWGLNRSSKDRSVYRTDPIEPPTGYEDVDMTAPRNFGPDSMVEILRSKGVDIGDGKGGIPMQQYLEEAGQLTENSKSKPEAPKISAPTAFTPWVTWIAMILCLIILIMIFYFLSKRAKGKHS